MKVDAGKIAERAADDTRPFVPLVEYARECGVTRTNSYELVRRGLIETFKIGRIRYVVLDSWRSLPQRAGPDGAISLKPETGSAQ